MLFKKWLGIATLLATPQPCEFVAQLARGVDFFPYLTRVRVPQGIQVFLSCEIAFMFQVTFSSCNINV